MVELTFMALYLSVLKMHVSLKEDCIMSSCVRPLVESKTSPVVLLHGFDRSLYIQKYTVVLKTVVMLKMSVEFTVFYDSALA